MGDAEQELTGGNASGSVVRVGHTIRKPWLASTPHVAAFVKTIRDAGVDAPAFMGRDDQGRQVQEFVPGTLAIDGPPLSRAELSRVGSMVRAIHDASEGHRPALDARWDTAISAPGAELICHNDLAPWNLITGDRWVFIDWDASAPSTRLWDLAYAAQAFTLSHIQREPAFAAFDLAAFVDGYRADSVTRAALPAEMARRTAAMYNLLADSHTAGAEPWASMYAAGHGDHWKAVHTYVLKNQRQWAHAIAAPVGRLPVRRVGDPRLQG